jgi:hypothetical protein
MVQSPFGGLLDLKAFGMSDDAAASLDIWLVALAALTLGVADMLNVAAVRLMAKAAR